MPPVCNSVVDSQRRCPHAVAIPDSSRLVVPRRDATSARSLCQAATRCRRSGADLVPDLQYYGFAGLPDPDDRGTGERLHRRRAHQRVHRRPAGARRCARPCASRARANDRARICRTAAPRGILRQKPNPQIGGEFGSKVSDVWAHRRRPSGAAGGGGGGGDGSPSSTPPTPPPLPLGGAFARGWGMSLAPRFAHACAPPPAWSIWSLVQV